MSSSSPRSHSRWLADCRGQAEPIAAIVAVLAIGIGLALYAGVAADRQPETEPTDAEATMERVTADLLEDGVYGSDRLARPERYERPGEAVRITIEWKGRPMSYGPRAPPDADVARRPITVQAASGAQHSGVLIVEVWET